MHMKFNLFAILLIHQINTSNNVSYLPSTPMNVSISAENKPEGNFLNIFFTKAKLTISDRSLQYYLIDDLTITHTRISQPIYFSDTKTLDELKSLLETITTDPNKMNRIREYSKAEISPLIYQFERLDGSTDDTLFHDQQRFEYALMNSGSSCHGYEDYSFTLSSSHFCQTQETMRSLDIGEMNDASLKVLVRSDFIYETTAEGNYMRVTFPITLSFLDTHGKERNVKPGHFMTFNFRDYGKGWEYIVFNPNVRYGPEFDATQLNSSDGLKIIDLLNNIFSKDGKFVKKDKVYPVTNFVQHKFLKKLQNIINIQPDQEILLFDVLAAYKSVDKATFEKLDGSKLDENMRGKYKIVCVLKKSFKDDVFKTYLNPLIQIAPQLTTTSSSVNTITSTSTSTSTNKPKKEGLSKGIIALIVILVIGMVIGAFGWYYIISSGKSKNKAKLNKRNQSIKH